MVVVVMVVMMRAPDADAHARHHDDRPVVVMVVMVPVTVMMVVAIARDLHLTGLIPDALLARRTGRGIGRPKGGERVRDRVEQLGERFRPGRLRRRGGRRGLGGRIECRQSGDGADGADEFLVHEHFPLVSNSMTQRTRTRQRGACAPSKTEQGAFGSIRAHATRETP
jgi:hypothetical protein